MGQIAGTVGLPGNTTVHVDNALVYFEPTNASYYRVEVGTPYLDLTPRLFGEVNGTSEGSQSDEDCINTFKRLFEYNTRNPFCSNNLTVAQGEYFIEAYTGIYDRLVFAAWAAYDDATVDLSAADANSNGVLSSIEIADMFTLVSSASITDAGNTPYITEQDDGSVVYSFVLTVDNDIAVNDELTLDGPYTSLYTGANIAANTIQFN